MFYTVLNESQVYADAILNAPGVLLDLRDSPQVGSGWATYLGVDESDLVLPGGRSATVRICRKSVEELTPRQRRKQMRKEIAPRMAAEVASEEGVECDPLQLVAGLAMKEASSILDDKDHPVGGYFDIPPKEWGAEVMKQLRILGGRRLAMLGTTKAKAKRAKVIENLTISMEYVSTTYLGGRLLAPHKWQVTRPSNPPPMRGKRPPTSKLRL